MARGARKSSETPFSDLRTLQDYIDLALPHMGLGNWILRVERATIDSDEAHAQVTVHAPGRASLRLSSLFYSSPLSVQLRTLCHEFGHLHTHGYDSLIESLIKALGPTASVMVPDWHTYVSESFSETIEQLLWRLMPPLKTRRKSRNTKKPRARSGAKNGV